MIVNCHALGLDWERASLSAYIEALEAHNEMFDVDKPAAPSEPSDRMSRFMSAHTLQ